LGAIIARNAVSVPKGEKVMTDDFDPDREKREMRVMWIFAVGMVLLILGIMGINLLLHPERFSTDSTEISSQTRAAPPK
jgi:hypothetical protein